MTVQDIGLDIKTKYPMFYSSSNQGNIGNAIDKNANYEPIYSTSWRASGTGPSFIYSEFDCCLGVERFSVKKNDMNANFNYRFTAGAGISTVGCNGGGCRN
jgi:hypothetical protein